MEFINKRMEVTLLHHTPLEIMETAINTCWDTHDKCVPGEVNVAKIDRVVNKFKHASTSEHVTYNFYIKGCSRCVLQELARHRLASPSVKSTRYTLKELKEEETFVNVVSDESLNPYRTQTAPYVNWCIQPSVVRAQKYLVFTGIMMVDIASVKALENLREIIVSGVSNDKAKYCLPESYRTELTWTINVRSLKNFIMLRTDKAALWEIRELAYRIYDTIPDDHKFLYAEDVYNCAKNVYNDDMEVEQ